MAKSYKMKFDDEDGVWRTIGGRRVFIRTGQSLASAMKESGKFKNTNRNYAKEYDEKHKNVVDKLQGVEKQNYEANRRLYERTLGQYDNVDKFMSEVVDKKNNDYDYQIGKRIYQQTAGDKKAFLQKMRQDYGWDNEDAKALYEKNKGIYEAMTNKDLQKQIGGDIAKSFGAKEVTVNGEKINLAKEETQPYNSKAYAKLLSKSYMAEEEYEDKNTPRYIQDIDAARYGNMSDEDAIKNWIDGGADVIYVDDAREKLKEWGISVKNDDPYSTYKNELAKQLLPIYRSDKYNATLMKLPIGDLRNMAEDYNINIKGLSRSDIIAKLLAIFNNR